jgi:hypothetical protein
MFSSQGNSDMLREGDSHLSFFIKRYFGKNIFVPIKFIKLVSANF